MDALERFEKHERRQVLLFVLSNPLEIKFKANFETESMLLLSYAGLVQKCFDGWALIQGSYGSYSSLKIML